jgi:hypothetical protein
VKGHGRVIGHNPAGRVSFAGAGRSFSSDPDAQPRPVAYDCPTGHVVVVPMHIGASIPREWECTVHREVATLRGVDRLTGSGAIVADVEDARAARQPKTHWQHVLERRSIPELEALLAERLDYVRTRRSAA